LKIFILFSKEVTCIIDKLAKSQHFSIVSLSSYSLMQMKISTNIHVRTTLVLCMLSSGHKSSAKLNKSFLWDSVGYIEFIIKGIVYFIICKFYALHPLYQETNKLKYTYTYMYIHICFIFVFIYFSIYQHTTAYSHCISTSSLLTALLGKLTFFPLLQDLVQNKFVT